MWVAVLGHGVGLMELRQIRLEGGELDLVMGFVGLVQVRFALREAGS